MIFEASGGMITVEGDDALQSSIIQVLRFMLYVSNQIPFCSMINLVLFQDISLVTVKRAFHASIHLSK